MDRIEVKIVADDEVGAKLQDEIDALLAQVFADVDEKEIKEDFINPIVAHVTAFNSDEVIGWAGLRLAETEYASRKLRLGGFGIGVREDWRRKGVGTKIYEAAMRWLKKSGVEVAFLSARPASVRLFEKFGFVLFPGRYSWENVHGEIKVSDNGDGMIAPVKLRELFEVIVRGRETLHVGRGYW